MRLFKLALPVLFVTALALFAARSWTDHADAAARGLAMEHLRHQFSQRAAVVRAAPDAEQYRTELRALLRGWFAGQMELGNRWPALRGRPSPFVPPPPTVRSGNPLEWYELADSQVGQWREGRVDLLQTAESSGLRLDLLRVAKVAQHLAVDVAVWGAPEETEVDEPAPGKQVQRVTVPLVFKGLSLRFFDASGKVIARMDGGGEPALRLDVPERLAVDAPPGVVLARFEPALFPPGAAEVEWTLAVQLRTPSGQSRSAQGVWRARADPALSGEGWSPADKIVAESETQARGAGPEAQPAAQVKAGGGAKTAAWPARGE